MTRMNYCCAGISQKWVFAVMAFFSVFVTFSMRMCLPLTIPKMTRVVKHVKQHHDETCPGPNVTISKILLSNASISANLASDDANNTYDWSEYTQGIILGSFYWGYVASHVPGGILAERFGGKHTLGLGIFATAVCTILTPLSITWAGSTGLIFLRVVMGLAEGTTQPALSVLLAQWVPPNERSKMTSFVFMGATTGVMMTSLGLGPVLRAMSWPGVYYIIGGLGVLWYLVWIPLIYDSPREHPFIGEREAQKLGEKLQGHTHDDAPPVPWRHLLTSTPFWALVIATVGRDWGGYILLTDMPKYTMNVLKMTVEENGILYTLNHIAMIASMFLFSWVSDWMIKRKYITLTNARKLSSLIGMSIGAGLIVVSSYVGCDKVKYIVMSCIAMAATGAGFPGLKSNVLDLSPNYAGTVMAISHGLAGLCGIAGPYVVGILVPNETLSEWRLIFWMIFVVTVVSNIVFVIFGSGEVQEWNDPNFERKKNKNKVIEMKEVEKLLTQDKIQIVVKESTKQ